MKQLTQEETMSVGGAGLITSLVGAIIVNTLVFTSIKAARENIRKKTETDFPVAPI